MHAADVLVSKGNSFCTAPELTRKSNFRSTKEISWVFSGHRRQIFLYLAPSCENPPFTKTNLHPRVALQKLWQWFIGRLISGPNGLKEVKWYPHCCFADGYKDEAWGGCFSSDSVVKLENGADLRVRNLQIGDIVQVMTEEGKLGYSEIVMFADFKPDIPRASHVLIETENPAKRITLTPSHLIFTTSNSSESRLKSKQAGKVLPGEFLQVSSQGKLVPSLVRRVSVVKRTGMVAPVTMQGNVIVDGVLCSCYAMIADHDIAHMVFSPLRLVHSFASNLWRMDTSIQQGMHWYPGLLMKINALLGIYELSWMQYAGCRIKITKEERENFFSFLNRGCPATTFLTFA